LLQRRGTRALLRLSDNGQGLAPDRGNDGMGMDNMRSRAAQLPAGQWRILPGPAGGTVVEVSWSVSPDTAS
jgi:signal transduction histidine kinase